MKISVDMQKNILNTCTGRSNSIRRYVKNFSNRIQRREDLLKIPHMIGIVRIQCDIFAISFGMRSVFANLLAFKNYHKLCEIILTGG